MMLWMVLGLVVSRDVDISMRDTFATDVMFISSSWYGSAPGSYTFQMFTPIANRIVHDGEVLPVSYLQAVNPLTGVGLDASFYMAPDGLYHGFIRLYDLNAGGEFIGMADFPAPSVDYTPGSYKATPCGDRICVVFVFQDYSTGNGVIEVYSVDASANVTPVFSQTVTNLVNEIGIYGNDVIAPDTAALVVLKNNDEADLYGLDISLPASSNPVISYTAGSMVGVMLGGGMFFSGSSTKFVSLIYKGSSQEAIFLGFDINTGSVFQNTELINQSYVLSDANSRGFCMASYDGTDTYVYLYDVFTGNMFGDTLSSISVSTVLQQGIADVCAIGTIDDVIAVDMDDRVVLGTYTASGATGSYSPSRYYFNSTSSFDSNVRVVTAYTGDTLWEMELRIDYSGISLSSIDTVPVSVPIKPYYYELQARDGYVYLKKTEMGFVNRILKTDLSYNPEWLGDTISSSSVYLPLYMFDFSSEQLKKLDDATGNFLPYTYNIPGSTYGPVRFLKQDGSNVYVASVDYYHNLHLHVLNASNLSGSAVDMGVAFSTGTFDVKGDTFVFAYGDIDDGDAKLYVYDISGGILSGPHVMDYDASDNDNASMLKFVDGNMYLVVSSSSVQKFVKCTADLGTCVDVSIDPSTYGYVADYDVDDGGNVFILTYNSLAGSSYILSLDPSLVIQESEGPIPYNLRKILDVGEYLAVLWDNAPNVFDTTFVEFVRKSDLGIVDYADTLTGTLLQNVDKYEYSPGQYYLFVTADEPHRELARLIRYNIADATGKAEASVSFIRYEIENGMLILRGRGNISVRVYDVRGRLMGRFDGYLDGRKGITRLPAHGVYLLDINGKKYKVVNINR